MTKPTGSQLLACAGEAAWVVGMHAATAFFTGSKIEKAAAYGIGAYVALIAAKNLLSDKFNHDTSFEKKFGVTVGGGFAATWMLWKKPMTPQKIFVLSAGARLLNSLSNSLYMTHFHTYFPWHRDLRARETYW